MPFSSGRSTSTPVRARPPSGSATPVALLSAGATDPQLSWNGGGSLTLQSEQVAGMRVENPSTRWSPCLPG